MKTNDFHIFSTFFENISLLTTWSTLAGKLAPKFQTAGFISQTSYILVSQLTICELNIFSAMSTIVLLMLY